MKTKDYSHAIRKCVADISFTCMERTYYDGEEIVTFNAEKACAIVSELVKEERERMMSVAQHVYNENVEVFKDDVILGVCAVLEALEEELQDGCI